MHEGGTKIQDPCRKFLFPVDPVLVFSDAAGVEEDSSSLNGMGLLEERSGKWLLSKWTRKSLASSYPFWRGSWVGGFNDVGREGGGQRVSGVP